MVIPRHKVCDICEEPVGVNKRYFIIKSKVLYVGYAGSATDNRKHHICEDCMFKIRSAVLAKESEAQLNPTKDLINDIVGFDVSKIKPLPEFTESEAENDRSSEV